MKIYQIISEAPPAQKASARIQARQQAIQANTQAQQQAAAQVQAQQQAVQQAQQQAAAQVQAQQQAQQQAAQKAATRQGRVDTAKTMAYNKANPVKGKLYSILGTDVKDKLTNDQLQKLNDTFRADNKYKQSALGKWEKGKIGTVARRALTVLQLSASCINLYIAFAAADDWLEHKEVSPRVAQEMKDYALRKFTLEVAAQIAVWSSSVLLAKALAVGVRAIMLTLGIATGGTALAGLIASEVAMQTFLAYIKTRQGQEQFGDWLAGVLIDDDSIVGSTTGTILNWVGLSTKVPPIN